METQVEMIKTEKQILADNKAWEKSLRIWRKINKRIRIRKVGDYHYVESRINTKSEWQELSSHGSIKRAVRAKHNATHRVIRDLGYLPFFKERRLKRKK